MSRSIFVFHYINFGDILSTFGMQLYKVNKPIFRVGAFVCGCFFAIVSSLEALVTTKAFININGMLGDQIMVFKTSNCGHRMMSIVSTLNFM